MAVVALVVAAVVMAGVVRFCSLAPVPILCSMCDSELETPHAGLLAYPKQQTITSTASANFLRSGCFGQSISFQRQKKEGGHCLKAMRCNPVEQDTQTGGQTDRWAGTHTHSHSRMGDRVSCFRLSITHSKRQAFLLITATMLGSPVGTWTWEPAWFHCTCPPLPKDSLGSRASADNNAAHKLLSVTAFPLGAFAIALQTSVLLSGEMPRDRRQLSWAEAESSGFSFPQGQKVGHNECQVLPCEWQCGNIWENSFQRTWIYYQT